MVILLESLENLVFDIGLVLLNRVKHLPLVDHSHVISLRGIVQLLPIFLEILTIGDKCYQAPHGRNLPRSVLQFVGHLPLVAYSREIFHHDFLDPVLSCIVGLFPADLSLVEVFYPY